MRKALVALLLACCLLAGTPLACYAAERKLLIVIVDKVTWHDLLAEDVAAPTLRRLAQEGAPGMMCARAARGFGGEYATIGAGSRAASRMDPVARASVEASAFQASERVGAVDAGRVFPARTGWAVGDNAIVHLGIGDLLNQNDEASYPLQLGLLGGTLRRAGMRVACVGNADTADALHRELVAIGMDEQGLVPMGDVGGDLAERAPAVPYGLTTDLAKLLATVVRLSAVADLIVLDTGETTRVETFADSMTPTALVNARRRALEKADSLLSRIIAALPRSRWSVLVLTPSLRAPAYSETFASLAPVIWWPAEQLVLRSEGASPLRRVAGGHLLTSPSTRRPGIVVNTDVAPSVLAHFGLPVPPQMVGRPFEFEAIAGGSLERLESDLSRHDAVDAARPQLFRGVAILAAIALWLSALLMLIGASVPRSFRTLARALLLILLSAPAAMLLVALRPLAPSAMVVTVIGLSLVIALVSSWLTRWRSGYVIPSLLAVGLLVYDLVHGQRLLYWSPLSYSPASGARFYGIGNEYGGAFLGAAIIGAAALLRGERSSAGARALLVLRSEVASLLRRVAIGALVLALAALTGLPRFGANLGMSLALGVGGAILCLYLWRRQVGWPEAVGAIVAAGALVGSALALDYVLHGAETSHIGRFVAAIRQQGLSAGRVAEWQAASSVIARKLGMNFMLVRVSVWTDAAAAALGVLGVAVAARPPLMLAALRERAWFTPAIIASVAGAAAAFALNDSGIVAAAVALIYTSGSLGYIALGGPEVRL